MSKQEMNVDKIDGRRLRSQESRRRIVEAMLDLIRAGAIAPSAEEVAKRAHVGLRTVFRHFDDMESLYREISAAMEAEIRPVVMAPFRSVDWEERLDELIERFANVFERMMPFKMAADAHRHRSPFLKADQARSVEIQRELLATALPERLIDDQAVFEALVLILSFDAWRRLRQDQGLSKSEARTVLKEAADILARGAS